jgi:short-subunit dehydrogenase
MKIAIVTGASSGMGREFVKQIPYLYKELDEIWIIARRRERLETLAGLSPVTLRIFEGDLLSEHIYAEFQDALECERPDIRMLVNAAGFGKKGKVSDIAEKDPYIQMQMVDLNCWSLTMITIACLPYFSKGSRILNIASAAAFAPQPSFAVYAATKSYVLSFSRGLGAELMDKGIFVTAVCPGPVDTEFFEVSGKITSPLKNAVMAKPGRVVKKALLDSKKRKAVSVYGVPMKAVRAGARIIPHHLIMKAGTLETKRR